MWQVILILTAILESGILADIKNNSEIIAKVSKNTISQNILLPEENSASKSTLPNTSDCWIADNGNGTYNNPILYADYSDPDVVRVEDDYYMTASSFSSIPGLPVLHSKDLVNWKIIGYALGKYPVDEFDRPQHGNGVWAPGIRYHNNYFYIYWGDPDNGIYMVRSKNISGSWEKPVLILPGKGLIDPCPFWDDDGQAYLVHAWAASRAGVKSLLTLRKMNDEGTMVEPEGKHIFDGHDNHPTIEGPKIYKRNGYYYIFAPAGGVKTGWQVALRSKNIYGPYEDKIVLEQGSTNINGPHQGGWVDSPTGQSWFIHFQDCDAYGRIVHLQPLNWEDNWPEIGSFNEINCKFEPVSTHKKPVSPIESPVIGPLTDDEFNSDSLGLQWQWQANPKLTWYTLSTQTEYLRLFSHPIPEDGINLRDAGNVLLQKFPAPDFTATTRMTLTPMGEETRAGLTVMGYSYACLTLSQKNNKMTLTLVNCIDGQKGNNEQVIDEITIDSDTVYLRVQVAAPDAKCQFSYSLDDKQYSLIGQKFIATSNRWIGAKVGIFCDRNRSKSHHGGYADFDWFRIR